MAERWKIPKTDQIIISKRQLKEQLEKEILEQLHITLKTIYQLLPNHIKIGLTQTKPNFDLFKPKSPTQRVINLLHLGSWKLEEAQEILQMDAENITRKILTNLLK